MLKTVIIIVVFIVAIIATIAFCAYVLELEPAINLMNMITEPFSDIGNPFVTEDGAPNLSNIASAGTLVTLAGTLKKYATTAKEKGEALIENSGLTNAVNQLKDTKSSLEEQLESTKTVFEGQITEITAIKDSALQEAENAKSELLAQKEELEKAKHTIDTLHETLRRNKLSPDESIIKTVIT